MTTLDARFTTLAENLVSIWASSLSSYHQDNLSAENRHTYRHNNRVEYFYFKIEIDSKRERVESLYTKRKRKDLSLRTSHVIA